MEPMRLGTDDFAENPEPRIPSILLLDISKSMAGDPISELNKGLITFKNELCTDSLASKRVEVSVIAFGSQVYTLCDFTIAEDFVPPTLVVHGRTHMGEAVHQAIDSLEVRKQQYKDHGIAYYRPWLFLISDGKPNDPNWEAAAARAVEAERAKAFRMFCVGTEKADMKTLSRFCAGPPVRLKGLDFQNLFLWLSRSQKLVSRSTPGEDALLEYPTDLDVKPVFADDHQRKLRMTALKAKLQAMLADVEKKIEDCEGD